MSDTVPAPAFLDDAEIVAPRPPIAFVEGCAPVLPTYLVMTARKKVVNFWSLVQVRHCSECWEWTGLRSKRSGYGRIKMDGLNYRAHRLAYEVFYGITLLRERTFSRASQIVLHRCDNPPCCNPAHLILGSPLQNVEDCIGKGRARCLSGDTHPLRQNPLLASRGEDHYSHTRPWLSVRGSQVGSAKLTEANVVSLRASLANGKTVNEMAVAFGISARNVRRIRAREVWRHV